MSLSDPNVLWVGTGEHDAQTRVGPPVNPGAYLAKLIVDDKEFVQEIKIDADPEFPAGLLLEELELQ